MADWDAIFKEMGTVGGGVIFALTSVLTAVGTYKTVKAAARKTDAETRKLDAEAVAEAAKVEAARTEFEKALNDRTIGVMDALKDQVERLTKLVETQNDRIGELEEELKEVRIALENRTRDLHRAIPPICRKCEFFKDGACLRDRAGEICKYETTKPEISVTLALPPPIPSEEV